MSQARPPPRIIYLKGCPHTFIIAPAMLDALKHPAHARFRISTDDSGDTTHNENSDE
jgi:hypothetical protein